MYRNSEINKPQLSLGKTNDSQIPFAGVLTFFPDFNKEESAEKVYDAYYPRNNNLKRGRANPPSKGKGKDKEPHK